MHLMFWALLIHLWTDRGHLCALERQEVTPSWWGARKGAVGAPRWGCPRAAAWRGGPEGLLIRDMRWAAAWLLGKKTLLRFLIFVQAHIPEWWLYVNIAQRWGKLPIHTLFLVLSVCISAQHTYSLELLADTCEKVSSQQIITNSRSRGWKILTYI